MVLLIMLMFMLIRKILKILKAQILKMPASSTFKLSIPVNPVNDNPFNVNRNVNGNRNPVNNNPVYVNTVDVNGNVNLVNVNGNVDPVNVNPVNVKLSSG